MKVCHLGIGGENSVVKRLINLMSQILRSKVMHVFIYNHAYTIVRALVDDYQADRAYQVRVIVYIDNETRIACIESLSWSLLPVTACRDSYPCSRISTLERYVAGWQLPPSFSSLI